MSITISFKAVMSANFIIDTDDAERATNDQSNYSELYYALSESDEFITEHVLPAFKDMLANDEVELDTIGDDCGRKDVYTDAVWEDYVSDEFILEMKRDELVAQLHEAVDNDDYGEVTRLAALLSGQDIKQPWE